MVDTITTSKLHNLLLSDESETVEFKSSFNDETLETIGAFANTNGGSILIGVDDNHKMLHSHTD